MLVIESHRHEINRLHHKAFARATEAMESAKRAGELLLELKKALPHGNFKKWIQANLEVSVRQAQRYMAVAQDKPIAIREIAAKSDTVSLLPSETSVDRKSTRLNSSH